MLTLAMLTSLAACSGAGNESSTSGETTSAVQSSTGEKSISASESNEGSTEEKSAETSVQGNSSSSESKNLVVYFSASNTKDVDAVSSATPMTDGTSSVEWIANIIHDNVGGELIPIIPSEDYPLEYEALADYAKKERDDGGRPAFEDLGVDLASYDVVFVGYPIWWYEMPMIMDTFFDQYDFSGKTIIPFNTHAGSRDGGTYGDIKELEPNATVLEGLAVRGEDAGKDSTKEAVLSWLEGLDLE